MKYIFLILSISLVTLSSCRKIIDIQLEESDKTLSIEAKLIANQNTFNTKVSRSGNYFGENSIQEITDATVVLNDGSTDYTLSHSGNGIYSLTGFTPTDDQNYQLRVTQGGVTYEAASFMPKKVEIDTVTFIYQEANLFNDSGYIVQIEFDDPAGTANYYRIVVENGFLSSGGTISDLILLDDGLLNGNRVEFPLNRIKTAQKGDVVTMILYSLNKQSYDYYRSVENLFSGGGGGAPPANPNSNWSKDALGNFIATSIDTMTVVVK